MKCEHCESHEVGALWSVAVEYANRDVRISIMCQECLWTLASGVPTCPGAGFLRDHRRIR